MCSLEPGGCIDYSIFLNEQENCGSAALMMAKLREASWGAWENAYQLLESQDKLYVTSEELM